MLNINALGLSKKPRLVVTTLAQGPTTARKLAATLWPEGTKQPSNPANSVSMYISMIRTTLDAVGWRIRCEGAFYHLEPGQRINHGTTPNTKDVPRYAARAKTKTNVAVVRQLFEIIDDSGMTMKAVQQQSLVSIQTLAHWRAGTTVPYMREFCAVADMLGYDLMLKKRE